jgi:hypothetical protein
MRASGKMEGFCKKSGGERDLVKKGWIVEMRGNDESGRFPGDC